MSERRDALVARREYLLARSALLRGEFALRSQSLQVPLAWGDRLVQATRWLRENPAWCVGAFGALILVKPRRAWRWGRKGLFVWRAWRRARPYLGLMAQGWQRGAAGH